MRERRLDKTLPADLKKVMARIGSDLSAARRVRDMTQSDLAERMNVSRQLVIRMENGDSRVSFGAYAAASWIMGLEQNLTDAFDQQKDPVYQRNTRIELAKRVRKDTVADPEMDF